jgi:uncharacterized membrane protein
MMVFNIIDNTVTIPVGDYIMVAMIAIFMSLMTLLFFLLALKTRSLLDRYRLKYSFDRELESKEIDNIKNLDKREQAFKRRVFKD